MKKILLIALFSVIGVTCFSQKSKKELRGDKYFNKLDYERAIEKYNTVDTSITTGGLRNLAESYRLLFDTKNAEDSYSRLIQRQDVQPIDYYYYAYVLKENKKYLESNGWMQKFKTLIGNDDLRVKDFVSNANKIDGLLIDHGQFTIKNLDINSAQEDFGTTYYQDQIVFASSREGVSPIRREWSGNHLPFLDLYVANRIDSTAELEELKTLTKVTNKKYHEGPASFSADGKFMAFTKNSYTGKSSDGTIKFQIFFTNKNEDGNWSTPESFHKNDEEYSIGHPCLSPDGNTMYFASDMPGGYGLADIYKVEKSDSGEWGEPVNLGETINTEGNDMFPFFQEKEQLLFFASDGHTGVGGLDIFVSPFNGEFQKTQNLGTPINSNTDDFAFLIEPNMKKGYFSSNRAGGKGDDDIYSFDMLKPFLFGKKIEGIAQDKQGNILKDVQVDLYQNGVLLKSVVSDEFGEFTFLVEPDKEYSLFGRKEKYFLGEELVDSKTDEDIIQKTLELEKDPGLSLLALVMDSKTKEPLEGVSINIVDNFSGNGFINSLTDESGITKKGIKGKKIGERLSYNIELSREGYFPKTVTFNYEILKEGVINVHEAIDLSMDKEVKDLSELVKINPIKFDLNKYNIRPDAEIELNKIVEVMNKYPGMVVELGAHTDCRGSAKYNEKLSDNRAKSSAEYIKTKITDPDRISGKGYGESKILNGCTCEGSKRSTCNNEEHSINRRTEFKVISTGSESVKVNNTSTDSFDK